MALDNSDKQQQLQMALFALGTRELIKPPPYPPPFPEQIEYYSESPLRRDSNYSKTGQLKQWMENKNISLKIKNGVTMLTIVVLENSRKVRIFLLEAYQQPHKLFLLTGVSGITAGMLTALLINPAAGTVTVLAGLLQLVLSYILRT